MYNRSCTFRDGVMVAQMILDHLVWVRALVPEPNGPMVKWLRRCPLKAESGVQFPLGLPLKAKPHSIIRMRFFCTIFLFACKNQKIYLCLQIINPRIISEGFGDYFKSCIIVLILLLTASCSAFSACSSSSSAFGL